MAMLAVGAVSCETYHVDEPDTVSVAPLDGRYVCWAYDYEEYMAAADKSAVEPVNFFETRIAVTESGAADKVWVYVNEYFRGLMFGFNSKGSPTIANDLVDCTCVKADCSVAGLSFSANGVDNSLAPTVMFTPILGGGANTYDYYNYARYGIPYPEYRVTIMNGKIEPNGTDTPSGYKSDSISYGYERVDKNSGESEKYMVVGYRYTGWSEDFMDFEDFIDDTIYEMLLEWLSQQAGDDEDDEDDEE